MPEKGARPPLRSTDARLGKCPQCGWGLGEPMSGDVHCYVDCVDCGARFELDDPDLDPPDHPPREGPG